MESRWYLFAGQDLTNTKIDDRAHALHISKSEWSKITKHLDRKKIIQDALDKEAAIKKYLDNGSKSMTSKWENSLDNVRKRKEEERLKMIEQKKDDRMQKYLTMREEQEAVRKEFVDRVKKQTFMSTGHARDLTSALITSEVLHQRQKQIEFADILNEQDREDERKFAEKVRQGAIDEIREKEEVKRAEREKIKKYGEVLKKMIQERETEERLEREKRVKKEAIDNIEAVVEMEKIKQKEEADKAERKRIDAITKKKALEESEAAKRLTIKEDKEFDEVVDIYKEAKHTIECMRKEREKELRDAAVQRRIAVAKLVTAEVVLKTEQEENIIKKATEEREAAELAKILARREKDEKNKQERLKNREEAIQKEAEEKYKENELKKWNLLNRYKADQNMKLYEEEKKKKEWEKKLAYRKILNDQIEENREEQMREKAIEEAFLKSSVEEEDKKFYEYADELLDLAKKRGRTTVPIEKVILKYNKGTSGRTNEIEKYCEDTKKSEKNIEDNIHSDLSGSLTVKQILVKNHKPKRRKCRCCCCN